MSHAPVSCFRSAMGPSALNRRTFVRIGAAAATASLVAGRRAAARQENVPDIPEPFAGDTFVGVTSDPEVFIALILGPDEARAYLCGGSRYVAWLTGANADELALTAESGAELHAVVAGETISGEARLAEGETLDFTIKQSAGFAGLYEVVVADEQIIGVGAGDRRLVGVVSGTLPDDSLLIAGAVVVPEVGLRPLAVFASPDADGEQRWIVLEDGQVTGAAKTGSGTGYIDPVHDLAMPTEELYPNIISPRD